VVTRKGTGRVALPRYSYRRYKYQLVDYPKGVRLPGYGAFRALPLGERRKLLRRALKNSQSSDEFWAACRDPELQREAVSGALARLQAGNVGWAFILRDGWGVAGSRARAVALSAARRCKRDELPQLSRALGQIGGRAARGIVERIFEAVRQRPPRTKDEREQLYEAAAALLRLSPQRTDAAQILSDGLDGSDEDLRSFAACAVRDVGPLDRGAGPSLLRTRLRAELKVPDAYNFFVLEGQLCALSRRAFLKGCEFLLGHREWWVRVMAAERLVRRGRTRERARVLAWASGKGFGVQFAAATALGDDIPPELLRRIIRRGLARRSPFERHQTIWLLGRSRLPELREIARRALEREPDPELCAELRALLERPARPRR
jgi:hypothetical protein